MIIILRKVILLAVVFPLVLAFGSNIKLVKPAVVLVKPNGLYSNSKGCFGQNKRLDPLNSKDDKTLKTYFNAMVPAPSRSSFFIKRN
ncbi:hypothetical protein [Algibacter pacificus]|uniref:hypothetical protein n=1 Tax=Algibacter pacificus TaxID=2599389 RepID=UPI0011C8673D|nr:hypothetical protein [Algibacter pacificus]